MRTPTQQCLLCLTQHSDATGSHLMPNFLLKYIIGNRYYEAAWFIDTTLSKISNFFGSANISNTDTSSKRNEHVKDYIFCSRCEKWMANQVEGYTATFLNEKIRGTRFTQQYSSNQIDANIIEKLSKNVNAGIIHLCIYSIIYRILLKYRFDFGSDAIHPQTVHTIRQFVASHVHLSLNDLKLMNIVPPYPYTIFTNETLKMGDTLFGYCYYAQSNPEVFLMGRYSVLLHINSPNTSQLQTVPNSLTDIRRANVLATEIKTQFISDAVWRSFTNDYATTSAKVFNNEAVKKLAIKKQIRPDIAKQMLGKATQSVLDANPQMEFNQALTLALQQLIESKNTGG